jgi:hypothetical protein
MKTSDATNVACVGRADTFFAQNCQQRVDWPDAKAYSYRFRCALSHGVASDRFPVFGVSSITAWLTQASDRALPNRPRAVSVTTLGMTVYD